MFKKIFNNTLVTVFSYNSVIVVGKLLSSFVVSKVSAIYLGPAGYAIVGNFKNILQGVLSISSGGFQSGTIKYIAENNSNSKQLKIVASSVAFLSLSVSLILGVLLLFFSNFLSSYFLKDVSFAFVFKYLGVLLPLISFNFLLVYIFNGLQKFKIYTILISVANGLNALLTFLFIYHINLKGALISSVIVPVISLLSSLLFRQVRELIKAIFVNFKNISIAILKSMSTYMVMAIYSSILISLCYLFIRNKIIVDFDIETAGLWEAMNKISLFYMVFFSSLVTLYLLPKLAINKTVAGYYRIMGGYYKFLIPLLLAIFIMVFTFRTLVIKIFLTDAFESIEQYFYLQLIGDFLKVIAFAIAYQFHAKKLVTFYFISDAILYISFYIMSLYLINYFDLIGVFYAYIISTLMYLISVSLFIYFYNAKRLEGYV